jgi:hypothetical protein
MKKICFFFLGLAFVLAKPVVAQDQVDSVKFFEDQTTITMTLETDLKDLLGKKQNERYLPAKITMAFEGGPTITEEIKLTVRGNFRRETCYMPGLKLDFHNLTSPQLYKLDKLKLVCGCSSGSENEQLVLREYMAYKVFNQLSDKSFKVRLAKITFTDAAGKRKPYSQYGFFIEDVDDMAKRNGMKEMEGTNFQQESSNREHMTLVQLYQYLLGNTDWSVPNFHNVKLIAPKDGNARPFVIPYDFDISGFVDPPYATIDERFDIQSVRDRLYRGFPRNMTELQDAIKVFNDKKDAIKEMISGFAPFDSKSKSWLTKFTDEFYKTINNQRDVQRLFIDQARTN